MIRSPKLESSQALQREVLASAETEDRTSTADAIGDLERKPEGL
jgi:hypothetical protein